MNTKQPWELSGTEAYSTLLLRSLLFTLKRTPRMLYHTLDYYLTGPPRASWPLSLHLIIKLIKSMLASYDAGSKMDIELVQRLTSLPRFIPDGFSIKKQKISSDPKAILFFKDKFLGSKSFTDTVVVFKAEWVDVAKRSKEADKVILLLHGGAYAVGSPQLYRWLSCLMAKECSAKVLAIHYRLAPQFKYPCAVIDAVSAYTFLLKEGYAPSSIRLIGDSAGGGLVCSTLLALRDGGWPQPGGAVAFSPWIDLSHSFPSFNLNIRSDFLPRHPHGSQKSHSLHLYAPDAELRNPYVSPVWASNLSHLCPVLIQTGNAERLFDENVFFAERLSQSINKTQRGGNDSSGGGGGVRLEVYEDMMHVFQVFRFMPVSQLALQRAFQFMRNPNENLGKQFLFDSKGQLKSSKVLGPAISCKL